MNTWSEGQATSWVSYPHHTSPTCQVWLSYTLRKRRRYFFDLSRDHKIRGSRDFIHGFPSLYVTTLPSLVVISLAEKEIFYFLFVKWSHVTMWQEGHATSCMVSLHHKSPLCQVWWLQDLQKRRYFLFVTWRHINTWSKGLVTLCVSSLYYKFGGHRCCRRDILLLVCHVTSRDFVVRESSGILGEFLSL